MDNFFDEPKYVPSLAERVKALRSNLLVHSYLYYYTSDVVISDWDWQGMAEELTGLQFIHGTEFGWYDEAFQDWDGSTGMHLPQDEWVISKALYIHRMYQSRNWKLTE